MKRAVVFWACRKEYYLRAAKNSAKTAKRVMPDVDTVLLTDRTFTSRWFDRVIQVGTPAPEDVCFPPLSRLSGGTYQSMAYVGSEACFCAPIYDVFELVEDAWGPDAALVHTSGKEYVDIKFFDPAVPKAFPHWRSALVCFEDNPEVRDFLDIWEEEFHKLKRHGLCGGVRYPDQPALRTALYRSGLRFATLPPNYCCTLGDVIVRNTVRIIAHHEDSDPEALAREANRHAPHARLFVKGKSKKL